jgi:hypothetical protein
MTQKKENAEVVGFALTQRIRAAAFLSMKVG